MDSREREERSRIFWRDVGCFMQILFLLVCIVGGTVVAVVISRYNHLESSAICRVDAHVELLLRQDGLNWSKELTKVTAFDSDAGPLSLSVAHMSGLGVFQDIQSILYCGPRGVVVRATLKGEATSALFEVNWEKKIKLYEGYIP